MKPAADHPWRTCRTFSKNFRKREEVRKRLESGEPMVIDNEIEKTACNNCIYLQNIKVNYFKEKQFTVYWCGIKDRAIGMALKTCKYKTEL